MTTESPEKLAKIVEALQKNRSYQRGAWLLVTEAARKYAQMKAHGSYIDRGNSVTVCFSDRENMTKMYADEVLRAIERAYAEDALMGAALADAT
jgi:hypothetical protein